jgi:hypothetical protein
VEFFDGNNHQITHEFGANSRFKGNSFVDCTAMIFLLLVPKFPWLMKFMLPFSPK